MGPRKRAGQAHRKDSGHSSDDGNAGRELQVVKPIKKLATPGPQRPAITTSRWNAHPSIASLQGNLRALLLGNPPIPRPRPQVRACYAKLESEASRYEL